MLQGMNEVTLGTPPNSLIGAVVIIWNQPNKIGIISSVYWADEEVKTQKSHCKEAIEGTVHSEAFGCKEWGWLKGDRREVSWVATVIPKARQ